MPYDVVGKELKRFREHLSRLLFKHVSHDNINIVTYGTDGEPINVSLECEGCGEVIIDFDL